MSARNYWTDDELVSDAVCNRKQETRWRDYIASLRSNCGKSNAAREANNAHMRALASESVLVDRIERILRRQPPWRAPWQS